MKEMTLNFLNANRRVAFIRWFHFSWSTRNVYFSKVLVTLIKHLMRSSFPFITGFYYIIFSDKIYIAPLKGFHTGNKKTHCKFYRNCTYFMINFEYAEAPITPFGA